jgi:hypothetical protein
MANRAEFERLAQEGDSDMQELVMSLKADEA